MLSRVSSVISELIKPISSSTAQEAVRERPKDSSKRGGPDKNQKDGFQKFTPPPAEEKSAKIIPFPRTPEPGASVTHSFLTLFSAFKQTRGELLRWFAHRSYRASGTQRKMGRYKKGAMLDQKAE